MSHTHTQEDRNSFVRETASCTIVTFSQVQKSCSEDNCEHVVESAFMLLISVCAPGVALKV